MLTLASDFGSPYPAAMRGVILDIADDPRLVDVAHDFPRQDVRAAAFWLREVLPWFPPAVHLVVVDPGVGTERSALALRVGDHALVGPDNGVLLPAARALAADDPRDRPAPDELTVSCGVDRTADVEVFEVEYDAPASHTFHGRDVFAPAAARVHEVGVERLPALPRVRPADGYEEFRFPAPTPHDDGVDGEVLVVDGFGNAVTNIPGAAVADRDAVRVNGDRVPVARAYAAVEAGDRLVTVGSHGNVELAVNRGRGDAAFGVESGDAVALRY